MRTKVIARPNVQLGGVVRLAGSMRSHVNLRQRRALEWDKRMAAARASTNGWAELILGVQRHMPDERPRSSRM